MPRKYSRRTKKASPEWYNKKYSVGDIAAKAWSGVKAIQAVINSEEMVLDTNISGATVANTAIITHLNAIAQSDGPTGRTGNSCLMKNLTQQSVFYAGANTAVLVRVMLFIDKQQLSDTAPSVTDLLEASTPFSYRNKITKERFQVLEDRIFTVSANENPVIYRKFTNKLDRHAIFNGSATSDIQKNGVYSLIISDIATTYASQNRLRFHDN